MVVLKYGSIGADVKQLQTLLGILADGHFGLGTKKAVIEFQTKNGLIPDGVVGSLTWNKLLYKPTTQWTPNIWKMIRRYDSNVYYAILPQDKYFVDLDFGIMSRFETVSTVVKSKIAEGKKPVCAINGGYFGGTNIEQMGLSIDEGVYRNKPDVKLIDLFYRKDGKFYIDNWNANTPNVWAQRNDFYWAMGTTYSLIQNGVINLENIGYHSHAYSDNPRTLVGQKANGDIVFVVIDGRSSVSKGVTAKESAQIAMELGMYQATNLDGGGSSCFVAVVDGKTKLVNRPSDGSERRVGSVLIAYQK